MRRYPPSKKIKRILADLNELEPVYSIEVIDSENVIYHKINDKYDIEVSGLDNQKRGYHCTIYVWEHNPLRAVETIEQNGSISGLADTLVELRRKYQALPTQE